MRGSAAPILAFALAFAAPATAADRGDAQSAFLHGRIEAAALLTQLCANVDRRSVAAMCDDDPVRVTLALDRRRRAHWTALGPDALWRAVDRGAMPAAFARRMDRECFGAERRSPTPMN